MADIKPKIDYTWGSQLREKYSQLFVLRGPNHGGSDSTGPNSGEFWEVRYQGAHVGLYDKDRTIKCYGVLMNGEWHPVADAPSDTEVLKLIHLGGEKLAIEHPRPHLVVSNFSRAWSLSKRVIVIPGYGQERLRNDHHELVFKFPMSRRQRDRRDDEGSYQFWLLISLDAELPGTFIKEFKDLRVHTFKYPERIELGENTSDASHRVVREILGLQPPLAAWALSRKRWRRAVQGEVVYLNSTPYVVISPNEFNMHPLDTVVMAKCIQCEPDVNLKNDEKTHYTRVPLGPDGYLPGIDGRWLVDLALIRSTARATERLTLHSPPIVLRHAHRPTHEKVLNALRLLYG